MQQLTIEDWLGQDLWSGKMSQERSVVTEEKTSKPSSRKSSESQNPKRLMCLCLKKEDGPTPGNYTMKWEDGLSHTDYMTRNFSEYPSAGKESLWSLTLRGGAAAEILFEQYSGNEPRPEIQPESDSLPRDIKQSGTQGEETAGTVRESPAETSGGTYDVRISSDGTQNWRAHCYETDISRALDTGGENPDSNHGGVAITYGICGFESNSMKSANPNSGIYKADTARTLDSQGGSPACNQGGMAVVCAVDCRNGKESEINATLQADADHNTNSNNVCRIEANVRRLTPTECSRLQGFPDKWVDIGDWYDSKGKLHKDADSPKYKALGNSIALPFWFWLLRRISATYTRQATLGSLFSGIGGFDICWELCNGAGTARWQSEIEEFPIAVCKRRFGDEATGERGDAWRYINP